MGLPSCPPPGDRLAQARELGVTRGSRVLVAVARRLRYSGFVRRRDVLPYCQAHPWRRGVRAKCTALQQLRAVEEPLFDPGMVVEVLDVHDRLNGCAYVGMDRRTGVG